MVRESDGWVDTGVILEPGDELTLTATGKIWAGVALTGENGPEGWDKIDNDPKFPLPGSHPYALIAKRRNQIFYAGSNYHDNLGGQPSRLYLRTNDDMPGNGSGQFNVSVTVNRSGLQTWAVLSCKASDILTEPHALDYYKRLLSQDGQGSDNVYDYWLSTAYGKRRLSPAIQGWYTMPVTKAALDLRNISTRGQTATDCINAAQAGGTTLDLDNYVGIITVINVPTDAGYVGGNRIVIGDSPGNPMPAAFLEHEMGHVYGLSHSWITKPDQGPNHFWSNGGDFEYNDCWDIMSFQTCPTFSYSTTDYGPQGPELEGAYRDQLGWIPQERIFTARKVGPETIGVLSVNRASSPDYRLVKIPIGTLGYYTVEYRQKAGFDQNIPTNAVLIHEVRSGSNRSFLVSHPAGSAWQPGQVFQDIQNKVTVTIVSFNAGDVATVTIDSK